MHLFEVQDPYLAACTYNENYHQNNLYIDMSFYIAQSQIKPVTHSLVDLDTN